MTKPRTKISKVHQTYASAKIMIEGDRYMIGEYKTVGVTKWEIDEIKCFITKSNIAFILLLLLFGYNPYQPNPIAPRFLIVFCSLLCYDPFVPIVPICINYDKL